MSNDSESEESSDEQQGSSYTGPLLEQDDNEKKPIMAELAGGELYIYYETQRGLRRNLVRGVDEPNGHDYVANDSSNSSTGFPTFILQSNATFSNRKFWDQCAEEVRRSSSAHGHSTIQITWDILRKVSAKVKLEKDEINRLNETLVDLSGFTRGSLSRSPRSSASSPGFHLHYSSLVSL